MYDRSVLWRRCFLSPNMRPVFLMALGLFANVPLLHGQSSPQSDSQMYGMLLRRIEQLESDDQQLRTRVGELERMQSAASASVSTSDPVASSGSATPLLITSPAQTSATQSPPESDPQMLQILLHRVEQLESDDQQLRTRVAELERIEAVVTRSASTSGIVVNPVSAPPALVSSSAQTEPLETRRAQPAPSRANEQSDMPESHHMDVNKTLLNIRGFGDFGLYGGNQKGETTTFSLGQLNLFITSDISERFKVLTELVFEVHQNNDFEEDLERILLSYSLNDYFKLSAGRYHTSIGYYNTAFHHTTWFQTATDRPFIFAYEDEGGILPIHNVGVTATGEIPSGKLGLHYLAEVGNGRASQRNAVEPVQNFVDENNHKSVNF